MNLFVDVIIHLSTFPAIIYSHLYQTSNQSVFLLFHTPAGSLSAHQNHYHPIKSLPLSTIKCYYFHYFTTTATAMTPVKFHHNITLSNHHENNPTLPLPHYIIFSPPPHYHTISPHHITPTTTQHIIPTPPQHNTPLLHHHNTTHHYYTTTTQHITTTPPRQNTPLQHHYHTTQRHTATTA